MPNFRAQLPLDHEAVTTANGKLWQRFPELEGRQLTPNDDPKYRNAWIDEYKKAGGAIQESVPSRPGTVVAECPPKKEAIDLEFRRVYWDGTPIPNLPYTVTLPGGSQSGGQTDATGYTCHKGVTPGEAIVTYGDDPNPAKCAVSMDIDDDFKKLFSIK